MQVNERSVRLRSRDCSHRYYGWSWALPLNELHSQDFSHRYMDSHLRSLQRSKMAAGTEMWISETAAAWASGTAGVCDGFVSGFWWLDQLGMAATKGPSVRGSM